jgi:hypothetical protein
MAGADGDSCLLGGVDGPGVLAGDDEVTRQMEPSTGSLTMRLRCSVLNASLILHYPAFIQAFV